MAALCLLALCALPAGAQGTQSASSDVIARIKDEGLNRSQVMQTLSYLTDVIGPRLTASPAMKRANEWTRDKMTDWGLQNAHLEAWGPFGRGWELERFSAQIIAPQDIPLIAFPKAWSPGLKGPHVGEVVYVDAKNEADLEKYKGKLKGAIVLNAPTRDILAHFEAPGNRFTDEQLKAMEEGRPRVRPRPTGTAGGPAGAAGTAGSAPGGPNGAPPASPGGPGFSGGGNAAEMRARLAFASRKAQFLMEEGVALLVDPSPRGDGGTLFVQSATVPQPPNAPIPGGFGGGGASGTAPRAATEGSLPPAAAPRYAPARRRRSHTARRDQWRNACRYARHTGREWHGPS